MMDQSSHSIDNTNIPNLGESKIDSPLLKSGSRVVNRNFVVDSERVLINVDHLQLINDIDKGKDIYSFELAGPRKRIYFDPSKLKCAMVTCGGLCPGLNDIIRAIVLELYHGYGVENVFGIRYGLQGFIPKYGHNVIDLKPETVVHIHEMGGSILGSSRGPQSSEEVVDSLERMNVGLLFIIGGDGTLMAACQIADVIKKRDLKISVIGVPKTIDNDIHMVSRSFGFDTAVSEATRAVQAAHNESTGFPFGIGLIKLMGRNSGYIAATTALAQQDVNFVLIPEVDFDLKGPNGLFKALENRLHSRGHAVIVAAEGAGQKFFLHNKNVRDESGNVRFNDIGQFLKNEISEYFKRQNIPITLKFIDPSYIIRSLPANANDNVFCSFLGRDAVHAGMAGKTKMLIGRWNGHFVHVPMELSAGKRKQVDPLGKLWLGVLDATGQGSLKSDPHENIL